MKAFLKSLTLENFKGCKKATYSFNQTSKVLGKNGAGKSTIASAFYWAFGNCDYDLHNNPPIFPLDVEECTPTVRIVLDIDGKEITVAKIQKRTVRKSKADNKETVSLSNTYEVNSVECGERDFTKKLKEEYGFDLNLFLPLSHPDVFTGKKADEMRKILFSMASSKTDLEIAEQTENAVEVAELLKNYTVEEIKAMQTATLRKIKEEYGKDGEILKATIRGLEQAKVDIDVAELELQRNALKEQIAENKAKQEDVSKRYEDYQQLSDEVANLKMKLSDMQTKANVDLGKERYGIACDMTNKKNEIVDAGRQISLCQSDIERAEKAIERNAVLINEMRDKWKTAKKRVFDENSLVCTYCGQEYPQERKDALRGEFESHKANELADLEERGNELKSAIEKDKSEIEQIKATLDENAKVKAELESQLQELENQYKETPQSADISDTDECKALAQQIADKESLLQTYAEDNSQQQLKSELETLNEQLTAVECEIAKSENNIAIDNQIADLRAKQGLYEQNKADAEKIQYQLDLVSRRKNELLTDEINAHFDIVKFIFFTYQKNGDYKEICVPTVDNKLFGESTNTGREVLAKLDIINGLQRFYKQSYPVFVDGAECLSSETLKRIEMDCQTIFLSVDEGDLRIE